MLDGIEMARRYAHFADIAVDTPILDLAILHFLRLPINHNELQAHIGDMQAKL